MRFPRHVGRAGAHEMLGCRMWHVTVQPPGTGSSWLNPEEFPVPPLAWPPVCCLQQHPSPLLGGIPWGHPPSVHADGEVLSYVRPRM